MTAPGAPPVGQQEQSLLGGGDGPMVHHAVDLGQVLGLPAGGSTQQQVEGGDPRHGAVPFGPQEGPLVLREAGGGTRRYGSRCEGRGSKQAFSDLKKFKHTSERDVLPFSCLALSQVVNP